MEEVQGEEKEIIILYLVSSNKSGDIGFPADTWMLNVAITLSKRCVINVCDSETVGSSSLFEPLFSYVEASCVYRSTIVGLEDVVGRLSHGRRPKVYIHSISDENHEVSSLM